MERPQCIALNARVNMASLLVKRSIVKVSYMYVVFSAPPPKPFKHRPPPPTPEAHPQTRSEVSQATRDVFTKPTLGPDVVSGDKSSEKSDEGDYVSRLAVLIENYRDVVNNLTKRQARGPSILTKEWLVRLE